MVLWACPRGRVEPVGRAEWECCRFLKEKQGFWSSRAPSRASREGGWDPSRAALGDGGHSKGGRSKVLTNFGCQNVARAFNCARFWVRKGDPSGPVRRKSYDFAFRIPLCFEKRVNVGIRLEKRVHVRSDPSPTPLLFGVGGSGRRPVNPPTPTSACGVTRNHVSVST